MNTLVIHGNTNPFTFANAIIAANIKAIEKFKTPLSNVYVVHSIESDQVLHKSTDWLKHLEKYGICKENFIERVIAATPKMESINKFIDYLEIIIKGSSNDSNLIVDLTNGTTLQKNILSIAAYVLDINHQYLIDTVQLYTLTNEPGFLDEQLLSSIYIPAPDCTQIDNIAYLNLTEMVRYKRVIEHHTAKYAKIDQDCADPKFFNDNLLHSILLKLQGDISRDNAVYRIAASSIAASIEELLSLLLHKLGFIEDSDIKNPPTLGKKLRRVEAKVKKIATPEFDLEFLRLFNDFVLFLRNSTTHKGRLLSDLEKFKADLSVKMAFPFMEFYTDIVYPLLSSETSIEKPKNFRKLPEPILSEDLTYYYGLDGDNTGSILEELFIAASDEINFKKLSGSVKTAIAKIAKFVRTNSTKKKVVIFEAGDDLLFKGSFDMKSLQTMKQIYKDTTGFTCSIGYGKSFQEVYLALKLAKSEPGKNSIVGIELS